MLLSRIDTHLLEEYIDDGILALEQCLDEVHDSEFGGKENGNFEMKMYFFKELKSLLPEFEDRGGETDSIDQYEKFVQFNLSPLDGFFFDISFF